MSLIRALCISFSALFILLLGNERGRAASPYIHQRHAFARTAAFPALLIEGADGNLYGATTNVSMDGINTAPAIFTVTNQQVEVIGYLPLGDSVIQLIRANGGILYASVAGLEGGLYSVAPDGKLYRITQQFFNGTLCVGPDGALYGITTFFSSSGPLQTCLMKIDARGAIKKVMVLRDGGGNAATLAIDANSQAYYFDQTWVHLWRINADGTSQLIYSFPSASPVHAVMLKDGSFVVMSTALNRLDFSRINPDGSLAWETGFRDSTARSTWSLTLREDQNVYAITGPNIFLVPPDGRVTVVASETNVQPSSDSLVASMTGDFYVSSSYTGDDGSGEIIRVPASGDPSVFAVFNRSVEGHPMSLIKGEDGNMYGLTTTGGSYGTGVLFEYSTNGVYSKVADWGFATSPNGQAGLFQGKDGRFYTHSEHAIIAADAGGTFTNVATTTGSITSLVMADSGTLYGTMFSEKSFAIGSIFKVVGTNIVTVQAYNNRFPTSLVKGSQGVIYGFISASLFALDTNDVVTNVHTFSNTYPRFLAWSPRGGCGICADGSVFQLTSAGVKENVNFMPRVDSMSQFVTGKNGFCGVFDDFYSGYNAPHKLFSMTFSGDMTVHATLIDRPYLNPPGVSIAVGDNGLIYGASREGGRSGGGFIFVEAGTNPYETKFSYSGSVSDSTRSSIGYFDVGIANNMQASGDLWIDYKHYKLSGTLYRNGDLRVTAITGDQGRFLFRCKATARSLTGTYMDDIGKRGTIVGQRYPTP